MATRMRWTNTGASLIHSKPRDGAMVGSIDEPRPPRRAEHFHVYLHNAPVAKPCARTHDATTPARSPAVRRGDQASEEAGELICRIAQSGTDGRWAAAGGQRAAEIATVRQRRVLSYLLRASLAGASDKAPAYSGKIWDRGEGWRNHGAASETAAIFGKSRMT
jgi:hypothetical protein